MEQVRSSNVKSIIVISAVAAVIIAIVGALYFTAVPNAKADNYLKSAKKYLKQENYQAAIAEFKRAIVVDPMCVEAYEGMAEAYNADFDYEMAIIVLNDGVNKTGSSKLKTARDKIVAEHPDEICAVTKSGIEYHEYNRPEYGTGPICQKCGHENESKRMNYFDDHEIPYYNQCLHEFNASYVTCNSYDYSFFKIKEAVETVDVDLVDNKDGTKTYTIISEMVLEGEDDMDVLFFDGGICDYYSGVMLNSKETSGDERYAAEQTFSYAGKNIHVTYDVDITWEWVSSHSSKCRQVTHVTTPKDYDGLVYTSKKIAHWVTKEQMQEEIAMGIKTEEKHVDDRGIFEQFERFGIFFRIKGDFDL